jgi:hypothetical protein
MMSGSYLFPEEQVLDTFQKVWFETPDRVDKVFSKAMIYLDSGLMVFTNMRIIFQGKKFLFPIDRITFIGRHDVPGRFGMGEGYIRVDALDPTSRIQTYFFLGGGYWIWTVKRRSNELLGRMIAWNENVGRHTRI